MDKLRKIEFNHSLMSRANHRSGTVAYTKTGHAISDTEKLIIDKMNLLIEHINDLRDRQNRIDNNQRILDDRTAPMQRVGFVREEQGHDWMEKIGDFKIPDMTETHIKAMEETKGFTQLAPNSDPRKSWQFMDREKELTKAVQREALGHDPIDKVGLEVIQGLIRENRWEEIKRRIDSNTIDHVQFCELAQKLGVSVHNMRYVLDLPPIDQVITQKDESIEVKESQRENGDISLQDDADQYQSDLKKVKKWLWVQGHNDVEIACADHMSSDLSEIILLAIAQQKKIFGDGR